MKSVTAPGANLEKLGSGFAFTEGPAADHEGNVYFTDQPNDRIVRWDARTGEFEDWLKPSGRSNGMFFDGSGNLISCADEHNQLWRIAPDRSVTVLVDGFEGKLLNGPNDVYVRPDGGMYFSDPLYARDYWERDPAVQQSGMHFYYLSPDGQTLLQVTDDITKPNGLIGTPDGKFLYVSDIGESLIYRYRISADGTLSEKTKICENRTDGMTMDQEGNIYCAGNGVAVFNPSGDLIEHIDVPEHWTGNLCFAGLDRQLLFITASSGVYGIRMRVKGAY